MFYFFRLHDYERNANFMGESVVLPTEVIPEWPECGFRQLTPDHRPYLPKIKDDHLETYFIHRLASDKVETMDIKAITKGTKLFEAEHVKACSIHKTQQDIYFTGIVAASMKKKVN